jgi:hypothetical protein
VEVQSASFSYFHLNFKNVVLRRIFGLEEGSGGTLKKTECLIRGFMSFSALNIVRFIK